MAVPPSEPHAAGNAALATEMPLPPPLLLRGPHPAGSAAEAGLCRLQAAGSAAEDMEIAAEAIAVVDAEGTAAAADQAAGRAAAAKLAIEIGALRAASVAALKSGGECRRRAAAAIAANADHPVHNEALLSSSTSLPPTQAGSQRLRNALSRSARTTASTGAATVIVAR